MGKTPGKWIKNLFLGKKSSKSSHSKGRVVLKSSNKEEQIVSPVKFSVSDPTISSPLVANIDKVTENRTICDSQSNEIVHVNGKENISISTQTVVCTVNSEDTEKLKLEQAATKAQAAFRGYAVRREIRSQKRITVLQAHIRGHLVRRQAVSTLYCIKAIVKFQALVRDHKDTKKLNSLGGTKLGKPSENAFAYKLRASQSTVIPLQIKYSSEELNSASLWLERWTNFRFWDPRSEPKKITESKPRKKSENSRTTEAEQDSKRRSLRRLSGSNTENGSAGSTLDSEKGKQNPKKVPRNPTVNTLQEHSPNEIEKIKRGGSRKSVDSALKAVSDRSSPVENMKPKQRTRKTSAEKAVMDFQSTEIKELSLDFDCPEDTNIQRQSERRASLPAKFDTQETIMAQTQQTNTPKLPSYMAPTESVRAKLRAQGQQGSPRYSKDVLAEKNSLMRRHSLSSSTNSMLSMVSPRAHKLAHASARGPLRGDRSFSSSTGADKLVQAEWRR